MVRPAGRLSQALHRPIPAPPEALRRGPFRRRAFTSALRGPWLTSRLGLALGIAFGICFATGLLSHLIQHPPSWFWWPSRPVGLYRVTQGVHVATGSGQRRPAHRQALVGLPQAVRLAAVPRCRTSAGAGLRAGPRCGSPLSGRQWSAQRHVLVLDHAVRVHRRPLLGGLARDRRSVAACRGEAADHPGSTAATGRGRPRAPARPVPARVSRHRRRRGRRRHDRDRGPDGAAAQPDLGAGSPSSGHRPAGRTGEHLGDCCWGRRQLGRPGVPADGRRPRTEPRVHSGRAGRAPADDSEPADHLRRGLERRRRMDRSAGAGSRRARRG